MPTPVEILMDPISIAIISMYLLLMLWEALAPARRLPPVPSWHAKGITFFIFYFYLSTYLPLFYSKWLPSSQLIDLSTVNTLLAGIAGVLLYEFGMYVWHRAMHRNSLLWKICHQMHHSAERLDTYGAFYFSPFDMTGWTLLGTICFSFVAGLPAQSVSIILLVTNFFSMRI